MVIALAIRAINHDGLRLQITSMMLWPSPITKCCDLRPHNKDTLQFRILLFIHNKFNCIKNAFTIKGKSYLELDCVA